MSVKEIDFNLSEIEIKELFVFFPLINGYYRSICLYNGYNIQKCNNNENSLCMTKYYEIPTNLFHKFDGKNAIKCLCG